MFQTFMFYTICVIVLDFWKIREKQLLEFYEQVHQKSIDDFLSKTKSPCRGIYRQIIDIVVAGK